MKLPGIQYGRPVQSLGRGNVSLVGADARLKMQVASGRNERGIMQQVQKTADVIYKSIEASKQAKEDAALAEVWVGVNAEQQDLKSLVDNEPALPREEVTRMGVAIPPEYASDELIPTHEVYFDYYDARLKEINNGAVAKLPSPYTKTKFSNQWNNIYIGLRGSALVNQNLKNKEATTARYNLVYDTYVKSGQENLAKDTINSMYDAGVLDQTAAMKMHMALPETIDTQIVNDIILAGNETDLNQVITDLQANNYRFDSGKSISFVGKAVAKLNRFEKNRDELTTDWKDSNETTSQIALLNGDMSFGDIAKNSSNYTPEGFRRLVDTAVRVQKGDGVSDPSVMSSLRNQTEDILFPPRTITVTGAATSALKRARQEWISGNITKNEYDELKVAINDNRNMPYRTEDYKTVEKLISKQLGVSIDRISLLTMAKAAGKKAFDNVGAKEKMAAQALEDLRSQIRLQGMDLDPMNWWVKNQASYSPNEAFRNGRDQYNATYGAVINSDGSVDGVASRYEVFQLEADGTIDAVERMRRIDMIDGK